MKVKMWSFAGRPLTRSTVQHSSIECCNGLWKQQNEPAYYPTSLTIASGKHSAITRPLSLPKRAQLQTKSKIRFPHGKYSKRRLKHRWGKPGRTEENLSILPWLERSIPPTYAQSQLFELGHWHFSIFLFTLPAFGAGNTKACASFSWNWIQYSSGDEHYSGRTWQVHYLHNAPNWGNRYSAL